MKAFTFFASALLLAGSANAAITFVANLTPEQVLPKNGAPSPAGVSTARGIAVLTLEIDGPSPSIDYRIDFTGLNLLTDITGIHIHFGNPLGNSRTRHLDPDQINGPHALNIFGMPRADDLDMVVAPDGFSLSGRWDNSDVNFGPDGIYDPGDSLALGEAVLEVLEGETYIQVHTLDYPLPDTGELRGQIVRVPEPSSCWIVALSLGLVFRRRR